MSNRRIKKKKRLRSAEEKLLDAIFGNGEVEEKIESWPDWKHKQLNKSLIELRRNVKFRIGQEKAKCKLRASQRRAKRNGKE